MRRERLCSVAVLDDEQVEQDVEDDKHAVQHCFTKATLKDADTDLARAQPTLEPKILESDANDDK